MDAKRISGWQLGTPCRNIRAVIIRKDRDGSTPFSNQQFKQLCDAARLADGFAKEALRVFNNIWKKRWTKNKRKAWKKNATIVRWLGDDWLSRRQIRVVRRRIRRIERKLRRGIKFVIVQQQDGSKSYLCETGDNAYANLSGIRVYLCPQFFTPNVGTGGPYARARTIIHELVHLLGWGHAVLDGHWLGSNDQDKAVARDLARRRPIAARHNPVNYAWLLTELACGGEGHPQCKAPPISDL